MTRAMESVYMQWAKQQNARFHLAGSGVLSLPMEDLEVSLADVQLTVPGSYGYEPLLKAIAERYGVSTGCVVFATGTSMANHLAMASLIDAGDEVLIESPTYEPLLAVARYLRAKIRRFERRFEESFRLDPEEIRKQVTQRTRLIVITNLHNPSGVKADHSALCDLGQVAKDVGAKVLVDEVYLECLYGETKPASTAFAPGGEFVATCSLTKAYGLGGLRCGWILAEPELARRIWRMNDLFGVNAAHPAECFSVIAFRRLASVAARARTLLNQNRLMVRKFLELHPQLDSVWPEYGTIVFPRLRDRDTEGFCRRLLETYDTLVTPGRFFEKPEHFRIGMGGDPKMLESGLERIDLCLAET